MVEEGRPFVMVGIVAAVFECDQTTHCLRAFQGQEESSLRVLIKGVSSAIQLSPDLVNKGRYPQLVIPVQAKGKLNVVAHILPTPQVYTVDLHRTPQGQSSLCQAMYWSKQP
jgi:hypothetical protein